MNDVALGAYRKHVAIACGDQKTYLYIFNNVNGDYDLKQEFADATDECLTVEFDSAEEYLAVGSADGNVRIYREEHVVTYN